MHTVVQRGINGTACRLAHITGSDRLPAGVVRQNTGDEVGSFFGHLECTEDDDQFGQHIGHGVVKDLQAAVQNHGQEQQQHAHGHHSTEHAEALHDKGRHPLLELTTVIQRHRGHHGRRDQIEQHAVEDAGHTVEDDGQQALDQLPCRQEEDDIVECTEADIEVGVDLTEVIDALFTVIIRGAEIIRHRAVYVIVLVFRRCHRDHQEEHAIQRHRLTTGLVLPLIALQRLERTVRTQDIHSLQQCLRDALIVDVHLQIAVQTGGVGDFLQHRLPCIDGISVHIRSGVIEIKHALLRQILHIRPQLVEAAVDVIAAVVRRVHRIVADGVEHAGHGRQLFIGIGDGLVFPQFLCVDKHIVDLLHQQVRGVDDRGHQEAHA